MNTLGAAGIALIKSFEQCKLVGYLDQHGIPTVGWGHTGPEVFVGLVWTQDQADAEFVADCAWAVNAVNKSLDVAISQNAFDALCSFTFNDGVTAEAHSTLLRYINAGNMAAASAEFPKWNHCAGVVNAGLTRRRAAEQALFNS